MRVHSLVVILSLLGSALVGQELPYSMDVVISKGNMPNVAIDSKKNVHIVFGVNDSIMYVTSTNSGKSFSKPRLVAELPGLFASAMRGPQITGTASGVVITACTKEGNIYSFALQGAGWTKARVNEVDDNAKEALMALGADGHKVFAAWLAVKSPKGQYIYGTQSHDGGKTWEKNVLVYDSPDQTVCECCKPSVALKDNKIYVMFRNWMEGNRDLYLAESGDGHKFGKIQKLGNGSWKLNACPMDGGGLAVNDQGIVQTVWRREGKIYASVPANPEKEIGEGRSCTVTTIQNKNLYAWTENGNVVIFKPSGEKIFLGKGSLPIVKAVTNRQFICVWEKDNTVHASFLDL
jgi:hypothetical protein